MKFTCGTMPSWQKEVIAIAGLLLGLAGLPMVFGFCCVVLGMAVSGERNAIFVGLISFILMALTIGAGGGAFWHSLQSMRGNTSRPLHLPSVWMLTGIFILSVVMGLFLKENDFTASLFFPPVLLVAAGLPPLLAISWFTGQKTEGLTWRQGIVAFAGGATASAFIAVIFEILFPTVILALVFNLANNVIDSLELFFQALTREDIASAITSQGFIYLFIQIAIIAPLVEELAKPLVTLPLIGRLSCRGTFLMGAMAGAGFATLENILYAGFGLPYWTGILGVRALGAAIHPFGSGLVALGWRDILTGKTNAWPAWFGRYGLAVGMHIIWNAGSLLVITLAGAQFFRALPPRIDRLGLAAVWITLALLIVLGLLVLWKGRSIVQRPEETSSIESKSTEVGFTISNKAAAIWALICLAALVPAGIVGLQLLMR